MRLIADSMLGKLAKRLRMLGFDVGYEARVNDRELVRRARAEGRVLLTRDTRLLRRRDLPPHVFIRSDHVGEQLAQVVSELELRLDRGAAFTRCLACNGELAPAPKESVRGQVPPYVFRTQDRFARCHGCGRIYWRGTHLQGMERGLAEMGVE